MTRRGFLGFGADALVSGTLAAGCAMTRSRVTDQTSHRPWPLPATRWVLTMRWHDLLFLHWPLRRDAIEPLIPKAVELETFDGWCWIGVVPFRMSGVRPPFFPLSMAFPELNVRTYVRAKGKSGVWFFSLDAASPLAVRVARWFGLPYYNARITVLPQAEVIRYESVRFHAHSYAAELIASYRPTGPSYHAKPGSLDHWLTERYSLFGALRPGRVVYGEIHHPQWALQPAEVSLRSNTMARPLDIDLPDIEPVCHYARYQEVVAWPIVPLDRIQ